MPLPDQVPAAMGEYWLPAAGCGPVNIRILPLLVIVPVPLADTEIAAITRINS